MITMRKLSPAYWVRTAVVSLAAALIVASVFVAIAPVPFLGVLGRAFVHSFVLGTLAAVTLPQIGRRLRGRGVAAWWALLIVVLLALAGIGTGIASTIIVVLGLDPGRSLWTSVASGFRVNAILVGTIGIGMMLYEMQRSKLAAVTLELRTNELERERAMSMALEARLASLESRLHPHFLFNTLNAISALIHDDPDLAERTVERLAALLRFSLDATKRGAVPLAEELRIVRDYLEIEKARLGDRLSYRIDVGPDVTACDVPPLALQTLVENSVKHAIAPRPAGGQIRIEAAAHDDRIVVDVWDDGPGFSATAMVPGHGLENLQSRLLGRFGDAAKLGVGRRDGGSVVTLSLPRTSSARPVSV
ncbi:MAG: hypothetical protein DMD81_09595 [Candidatus Rokuibacteriota bacterium]|nr:MAG: hypothetical protein DMD81_09595 [Candidatus Rokubacteria bacterium]